MLDKEDFALHLRGGLLTSSHAADFRSIEGSVDCGLFEDGSGTGFSGSLSGEFSVAPRFTIGLGIGYADRSGELSAGSSFQVRDTTTGELQTVRTDHTLDATLAYLELQPELRFTIIPEFISGPLRLLGGVRLGFPMSASFKQAEQIADPSDATFVTDDGRSLDRDIAEGDIDSKNSMALGFSVGLENMLAIGKSMFLTQQIVYDRNLNDVTDDADWLLSGFRFEAGLRFSFGDFGSEPIPVEDPEPVKEPVVTVTEPVTPPVEVESPTVVKTVPKPSAEMSIRSVDAALEVGNELLALSSLSLVNAVFFDKNSDAIPAKYHTRETDEKAYDALSAHRHILLDIAKTVKLNPDASLTLRGATSGTEDEPEGRALALRRAETVKNALVRLGVPAAKIRTEAGVLPRNPSNQDYPEGREENRRVDVSIRNAPMQEFVEQTRFSQVTGSMVASVEMQDFPDNGSIDVRSDAGDDVVAVARDQRTVVLPINRRIDENTKELRVNASGNSALLDAPVEANTVISIDDLSRRQIELRLDYFEPILRFDYNSSVLSSDNKTLLRQMLTKIPAGAKITIWGSTDALGSEQRNLELSAARAAAVQAFIKTQAAGKFSVSAKRGKAKFSENSPEGRFLNRSIRIQVEEG